MECYEGQTNLCYYTGNRNIKIYLRRDPEECNQVNWKAKQNKTKVSGSYCYN